MFKKLFKKLCTFIVSNADFTFKITTDYDELLKGLKDYSPFPELTSKGKSNG